MAFHGIFMRMTVMTPSRCFGSLASKQTLVFKHGLPPPSQMRHISMKNPPKLGGNGFGIIGIGAVAGFGLAMVNIAYKKKQADKAYEAIGQEASSKDYIIKQEIPEFKPARTFRNPNDNTKIKFTLYQYQTCPFCCKARAFLDYFGVSYDVIEVNSVTRKQVKWSTKYKKVPMLVAELENGTKYQLMDSSAIVSTLFSLLYDKPKGGLEELLNCYPQVKNEAYETNSRKPPFDITNRYFLMFQDSVPQKDKKGIAEERKWRKWVDDTLVHTLSPNVYRSPSEALQAFQWFDKAGDWETHFKTWERYLVIYVGAFAMWLIGKNLKKRHHLKDDVRESFYDAVNFWIKALRAKGTTFMGGDQPDLADLAVYGVLCAIEGCDAFNELLEKTKVGPWYNAVKEACMNKDGQTIFMTTAVQQTE